MKSKFLSFILLLLTIVLLGGIVFVVLAVYTDLFGGDIIQSLHTQNNLQAVESSSTEVISKAEKKGFFETISDIFTTPSEETYTYSDKGSSGKHFYEQLSENQKILYNGLQESKDKLISGNYTINFGDKFHDLLEQENGSEILGDDYQTAIDAFTHDNPDLFYIDVSKLYLNMETKKKAFSKKFNVYIQPEEGKNYFSKGFNSEADVQKALNKIEQEKYYVKSKLTGNTYKDIKIIHDYLIDNVQYDESGESIGTYTIYGCLVDKKCVCEGYARTFKYLADMAGIENVLMQGIATNLDGTRENHAWNAVKLNGIWYLIDTTWDDPIIVGNGFIFGSTHYKYFLKGTDAFYKDHTPQQQFSDGGKEFSYPKISTTNY